MFQPWLPWLLVILLSCGAVKGALELRRPDTLPFRHIKVHATFEHLSQKALQAQILAHMNGGFFSMNMPEFRQELMTLPWVKSLSLRRIWPSTLSVTVVERQAVASWNGHSLVDANGILFSPSKSSFPTGLVALKGPADSEQDVMDRYSKIQDLLKSYHLQAAALTLTDRRSFILTLNNGVELVLGDQDIDARLTRYLSLQDQLNMGKKNTVKSVDLRYPNGFALTWGK